MTAPALSDHLIEAAKSAHTTPEHLALLIARDEYPLLNLDECREQLDQVAAPICADVKSLGDDPEAQAHWFSSYLYDRLGFHGNEDDYYDPRNSYLNDVITRRTGIPITLAVCLMAVGRRAGIDIEGIGFPGHFLVRIGGADGVLLDPFFGGRVLNQESLHRLAARFLRNPSELKPEHLTPVTTRSIGVRMLVNLKHAHERRQDHARALVVCDRLVDLTQTAAFRRDRGLHALALGSREASIADLQAYLKDHGSAADAGAVRKALQRAQALRQSVLQ